MPPPPTCLQESTPTNPVAIRVTLNLYQLIPYLPFLLSYPKHLVLRSGASMVSKPRFLTPNASCSREGICLGYSVSQSAATLTTWNSVLNRFCLWNKWNLHPCFLLFRKENWREGRLFDIIFKKLLKNADCWAALQTNWMVLCGHGVCEPDFKSTGKLGKHHPEDVSFLSLMKD